MYGNDYNDISSIKKIADEHDISIILVHHLRKLKDGDDPFNEVSGSTGITGAADTNYVLKRKRSSRDATTCCLRAGCGISGTDPAFSRPEMGTDRTQKHRGNPQGRNSAIPFSGSGIYENRTEWVGTATELIADMAETENHAQCGNQVLRAVLPMRCWSRWASSIALSEREKAGSSNFCAVTAMTQMTPESLYKEIPVTTVIAVTNRRKGVNKCAAKTTGSMSV